MPKIRSQKRSPAGVGYNDHHRKGNQQSWSHFKVRQTYKIEIKRLPNEIWAHQRRKLDAQWYICQSLIWQTMFLGQSCSWVISIWAIVVLVGENVERLTPYRTIPFNSSDVFIHIEYDSCSIWWERLMLRSPGRAVTQLKTKHI